MKKIARVHGVGWEYSRVGVILFSSSQIIGAGIIQGREEFKEIIWYTFKDGGRGTRLVVNKAFNLSKLIICAAATK